MGIFKGVMNLLSGGIIGEVSKLIDDNVTNDEERGKLHNELARINQETTKQAQDFKLAVETQLTSRHKADMDSDNKLSKNIRPAVLIYLTAATTIYIACGLLIEIPEGSQKFMVYNAGLQGLLGLDLMVYGFYFGSRGAEKVMASVAAAMAAKPTKKEDEGELGW